MPPDPPTEAPDPRSAIVAHRETLQSQPRPTRITEIAGEVAERHAELLERLAGDEDIYRLYCPEWVIVYTATWHDGITPAGEVETIFQERYAGRVRDEDVRITGEGTGVHEVTWLTLRLPNLKGEFKYAHLAQRHADEHGYADFEIVARNSSRDHEIRAYGTKRLRT